MPFIQISHTLPSDPERNRLIAEAVTAAYAQASGKAPSSVWVTINQVKPEDWSVGGTLLSDR
ncbi:hypothetical protein BH09ACT10_BH09ACT10_14440 [soil metagenome]